MIVHIFSCYMSNIPAEAVALQRQVMKRFQPSDAAFWQVRTDHRHPDVLNDVARASAADILIFLDIDCIPLTAAALPRLARLASAGKLAGCVQRANHIQNGGHLYVGPFCMAFQPAVYREIGQPSFVEDFKRADVGEELSYRWPGQPQTLDMLWPSHVEQPEWSLTESRVFGPGTTYATAEGREEFYHAFEIRKGAERFMQKCREVLSQ